MPLTNACQTAGVLLLTLLMCRPALLSAQSLLWVEQGQPTRAAREALAILGDAAAEGLDPASYSAGELTALADRLPSSGPSGLTDVSRFDQALSASMARYLHDLHMGRIDPRRLGFRLVVPDDGHDFPVLVEHAVRNGRLSDLVSEFRPQFLQYRQLMDALARYRRLALASREIAPAVRRTPIRFGDVYPDGPWLRERLILLGDLTPDTPFVGERYAGALVEGVIRFQQRHGLNPDGVIGAATMTALRVPVARRVRQIELALERLRWLPHQKHSRLLLVNIPMFQLWGWDESPRDAVPSFETGVIVGRALSTETPVFAAEIREVIFRPFWNVPRSILMNEIKPEVEKDPGYLLRNDMEIVQGEGDASPVVEASEDNLGRLWRGELRVRQRPGPRNALGLVKFVFPNQENVYLHGTPAQSLFRHARRDFSHGCVRVQDPIALAEWVLASQGEWTRERVLEAMGADASRTVPLTAGIDVLLFYATTVATSEGLLRFAEDIYRHDARLERALSASRGTP